MYKISWSKIYQVPFDILEVQGAPCPSFQLLWRAEGPFWGPLAPSSTAEGAFIVHHDFTTNCKTKQYVQRSLVPILATRELVAPLANDPIMQERLIQLFRHLKHQNLSTGDDFIYRSGIFLLVLFLATSETVALLANDPIMLGRSIQLFRHLKQ